jgi:uncharacterized membrane protein YdjX (TVP38/TMEM64 family)
MRRPLVISFLVVLTVALAGSILYLGEFLNENDTARSLIEAYGFLGMFAIGIVTGFNLLVPVHAASFTPVFQTAGFSLPLIVVTLTVGRLVADILAFQLARWGKESTHAHFPRFYAVLDGFRNRHHRLILPGIFLYAALAPLPNESLLIPLGFMGYHLRAFFLPLLFGTLINQILYTYGFVSLFTVLFLNN